MKRFKGPEFLRYAGMLGHEAIVTRVDADGLNERTYAETYPDRAASTWRELPEANRGRIFYRVVTPRTYYWREVSIAAATLDGPLPSLTIHTVTSGKLKKGMEVIDTNGKSLGKLR